MSNLALTRDGLIYVDEGVALGGDPRELRLACAKGELVRVRRAAYVPRELWMRATPRERHIMVVRAAKRGLSGEALVAGPSAAALWNLPYGAQNVDEVTVLVPYRGGGASERGLRRSSASFDSARPAEIDGIAVTDLARTALELARRLDFGRAVAVVDSARWRRRPNAVTLERLNEDLAAAQFARGARHLRRVVDFSTSLSDSPGESTARAAIHELGFEEPELQARFVDEYGEMFSDFYWRGANRAGEFDGKVKFTREEYSGGDPGEVAWKEKKREDRLRRQVTSVTRILTEHVRQPLVLARMLEDDGIPRRKRGG